MGEGGIARVPVAARVRQMWKSGSRRSSEAWSWSSEAWSWSWGSGPRSPCKKSGASCQGQAARAHSGTYSVFVKCGDEVRNKGRRGRPIHPSPLSPWVRVDSACTRPSGGAGVVGSSLQCEQLGGRLPAEQGQVGRVLVSGLTYPIYEDGCTWSHLGQQGSK